MIAGVLTAVTLLTGIAPSEPAGGAKVPQSVEQIPAGTRDLDPEPSAPVLPASPPPSRPDVNPFDRDLPLTAPLLFGRRMLGELPIVLTADDRVLIETTPFLTLVGDVVNAAALGELTRLLTDRASFESSDVSQLGVSLEYDATTLSVAILRIEPDRRVQGRPFDYSEPEDEGSVSPASLSAFVNLDAFASIDDTGDVNPGGQISGAARLNNFVFEAEGRGGRGVDGRTSFDRRFARLVYDQPEAYRRWYLGDLDPEFRGRQGYAPMGGFGVSRQRRRFNAFRSDILQGSRQLLLQENSTVTVLRNGVVYRELQLDAGPYDLSTLPLMSGSNDIEIRIRDITGRTQQLEYSAYLDPIDLEPGDYEYGAYFGVTSDTFFGSPEYDGDIAFSGFYRRAFVNRPALGVGLQASDAVQMVYGETQFVLRDGSRVQFNAAASNAEGGPGYAGGITYDKLLDRGGLSDVLTVQADYTSEDFSALGSVNSSNTVEWTVSGQYSRFFSETLYGAAGATYQIFRTDLEDSWRFNASLNYRVRRDVRVSIGADYGRSSFGAAAENEVGLRFSITWQPDFSRRVEAGYDQRTNNASLSYSKSGDGGVGSLGYGAFVGYDDGPANVSAYADYVGNRGTAAFTHAVSGEDFSSVSDRSTTSLSFGTSIATAGGRVALGRRINNSFAIVSGHESLRGGRVVAGDSLENGRYLASSGALGPAVFSFLTPFVDQSIRYDVLDAPQGYDVGSGVFRVRPSYKSGFNFVVGTDAFVTAYGTLRTSTGEAVALVGGVIRSLARPAEAPRSIFTNSAGRFAFGGLRPGERYSVSLATLNRSTFEFETPADTGGMFNLQVVTVDQ